MRESEKKPEEVTDNYAIQIEKTVISPDGDDYDLNIIYNIAGIGG